jgi:hypothetical protein
MLFLLYKIEAMVTMLNATTANGVVALAALVVATALLAIALVEPFTLLDAGEPVGALPLPPVVGSVALRPVLSTGTCARVGVYYDAHSTQLTC